MDRKTATRSIAASTSSSIPVPAPRYTSSIKDVKLPVPWGNRMTPKEYAGESKLSAGGAQWQSGPWLTLLGQLGVHRASSTSAGFAENPVQLDRSMYRMSVVETSVRVRLVNNATSRASVRESKTARCPRHHCNAVPHPQGSLSSWAGIRYAPAVRLPSTLPGWNEPRRSVPMPVSGLSSSLHRRMRLQTALPLWCDSQSEHLCMQVSSHFFSCSEERIIALTVASQSTTKHL